MSDGNAFNNFLTGKGYGPIMKDYQHASGLYVDSTYARAPKMGFLYFVELDINRSGISPEYDWWANNDWLDVGLLAKKADLPKFTIANETLNQYNRKTQVATKITYNNVSIEFHDDNSDITHNMWVNYYKNYVNDSNLNARAFSDTKYSESDYRYGLYDNGKLTPFFNQIRLYVLHQHQFTRYTLVNPKIINWDHDAIDQEGTKILKNKMTLAYESVIYDGGIIQPTQNPPGFATQYYDTEPSPYNVAGLLDSPVYDPRGESSFDAETGQPVFKTPPRQGNPGFDQRGKDTVFGTPPRQGNPGYDQRGNSRAYGVIRPQTAGLLQQLGTILAKNYINQSGLTRQKATVYNIAGSVMGQIGSGPGKYASPPSEEDQPGVFTLPGGVGINIFKGFNTTVDGKIRANPAAILFPPRG